MNKRKITFNTKPIFSLFDQIQEKKKEIEDLESKIKKRTSSLYKKIMNQTAPRNTRNFFKFYRAQGEGGEVLHLLLKRFLSWQFDVQLQKLMEPEEIKKPVSKVPEPVFLSREQLGSLSIYPDHDRKMENFLRRVNDSLPDEIELCYHAGGVRLGLWLMPRKPS